MQGLEHMHILVWEKEIIQWGKKGLILSVIPKKNLARQKRKMLGTGGEKGSLELSELDQCIDAIIGEMALLAVPSTEHLAPTQPFYPLLGHHLS